MPELPEVETVRRGLEPYLLGAHFGPILVRNARLRMPVPADFAERLEGAHIISLRRRAKYILIDCKAVTGPDLVLLVHLGMSGRMTISPPDVWQAADWQPQKHDHVIFDLMRAPLAQDGARPLNRPLVAGARILYHDPRRFGLLDLFEKQAEESHRLLAHLGPEPLSNGFDEAYLGQMLKGRKSPIKLLLLDQRLVVGLGNIYVSEALWRAGVAPSRAGESLSALEISALFRAIRAVLEAAIASGGSSLRDYVGASGELGYFQHSFDVYDRKGEPCRRDACAGEIVRLVQGGRSSYFCAQCQA